MRIEVSDSSFAPPGFRLLTVKSPALGARADITVYVPSAALGRTDVPVVLLLHGVYGSHWAWAFKGGAHVVLEDMIAAGSIGPFILAMPSDGLWGDGSGYVPHALADFEAWIGRDVPAAVVSAIPEAGTTHFISGLSMGGYGAFRVGVKFPFKGISAHSSITDIRQMSLFVEEDWSWYSGPLSVLELMLAADSVPQFRFDCGVSDLLFKDNVALSQALLKEGFSFDFDKFAGEHNWDYWNAHIADTYRFFQGLL